MGFFSKTCAKTHLPVVHDGRGYPELCEIVVLFPDGHTMTGFYDGYGRIDGEDIQPEGYDDEAWNAIKFVLRFAYEGETYDQLGPSQDEHAQGHFMDEEFLKHCLEVRRFPSFKGYEQAFKKLANW
jgi:hypothetical protein